MRVFQRVHIPSLDGAIGWVKSDPLGPAELRGHVVLVNFWTLTCINWLRQEPYVRAWSQAYRDDGLLVVGVHTPEFSFEHDIDGVRQAVEVRDINYPVAQDNDYAVWSAFANHYWPALYFVDADGVIRDKHFGEGRYEESEFVIQRLLGVARDLVSVEGVGVEARADWDTCKRPRPISATGAASSSPHRATPRSTNGAATSSPRTWASTAGCLPASGRSGVRMSPSSRRAAALLTASTRAARIPCSPRSARPDPVPRAPRRRGPRPLTRRRRRRGRQRPATGRLPVPARAPAPTRSK